MRAQDADAPGERRRHDRADMLSTSLLLELTTITVDPAYVEAAARRALRGQDPTTLHRGKWAAVMLAVISFLAVVAFRHTRAAAPDAARLRSGLLDRVALLTTQTDAEDQRLALLREQVGVDRDRLLASSGAGGELAQRLPVLELAAATAPAAGAGVTVRILEAPGSNAAVGARVQDRDLQRAVNVAWSAGAEAVAINGQRIGPLTAIRQAGESIMVDYRPVSAPYDIAVIGDPAALELAYTVSEASSGLRAIARSLEFSITLTRVERLQVDGTDATRAILSRPLHPTASEKQVPAP